MGAHALWASWGQGWALGTLCAVVSMGRRAASVPAPNSRFFKALSEPSLFPGWGQTGFWAQKDRHVQTSGAFGSAGSLLSSYSVAEFPVPGTPEAQLSSGSWMHCSPALYPCGPTGHWRFPWACNMGKQAKEALSCTTFSLSFFPETRKGKTNFPPGRSDESFLRGL